MIDLRRTLHRHPELSNEETGTARRVLDVLKSLEPDRVWTDLGGTGVAAAFDGAGAGPTVLVRCELDALPIQEVNEFEHRSVTDGVSHKCGHDGHMAIVATLAERLAANRPESGRAIVLFQPAEETGAGAKQVVADPTFGELQPDWAFALHNMPGYAKGCVVIRDGTFNCASRGLIARLSGRTSHAAHPENGQSPAAAMCELINDLGSVHQRVAVNELKLSTVIHARLGEVAFGTSPGDAVVMATLRAESNRTMERLAHLAASNVAAVAKAHGLQHDVEWCDVFDASVNDPDAANRVRDAARSTDLQCVELSAPIRWSEDFGALGATAKSAMFGLGAGESQPQLHANDYDFPDELIEPGAAMFERLVRDLLG